MNSALSIVNLEKKYGKQEILRGIDLEILKSSIYALLGPNGSGKTTLLKSILGIVKPSFVDVLAVDLSTVGYMPQQPNFPQNMRVFELLDLIIILRKKPAIYLDYLLTKLDVGNFYKKFIRELSGGMKQKVNIVQAFMFEQSLFLLDEPTLGLDPHQTYVLKGLIKERRYSGATVVFSSHIMSEVEELSDVVALIVEGEIYLKNSPDTIKAMGNFKTLEEALHNFWDEKI